MADRATSTTHQLPAGGTQDTLSNLHGGSVGVSNLHLEGGKQTSFSSTLQHGPQPWCYSSCHHSCELEELLHHVLLKIKAISTLQELPLCITLSYTDDLPLPYMHRWGETVAKAPEASGEGGREGGEQGREGGRD